MNPLRLLVTAILDNARQYTWSVQGFGLLRLYIRRVGRLHIWDSALRYPNVSMIHNHSWDLHSTIIAGSLRNTRFYERQHPKPNWQPYMKQRLVTGYNSKMVTDPTLVYLLPEETEVYSANQAPSIPARVYSQKASEIHLTDADDGAITLMHREEDNDGQADVYWSQGCSWGTAQPRQATQQEIRMTVAKALTVLERYR